MRLRFAARAAQDLSEIADYLTERNPAAARRVRSAIVESLNNIALFPHLGRQQAATNVRKHVTRKYPYIVYYVVDETAGLVTVLAIQHPSRQRNPLDA
jgi:plasmid stabilization system protein ParE